MLLKKFNEWFSGGSPTAPELDDSPTVELETKEVRKRVKRKRAPRRNFSELYPDSALVVLMNVVNPKRCGTQARDKYELYRTSRTVADLLSKGVTYRDIDNDYKRGYIEITK